jgi:hypothetical protein
MFVLIIEHDYAEWDVTIHSYRPAVEQAIRDFAHAKWDEDREMPHTIAGCVDYLATCNEYVKVFCGTRGGELCEQIGLGKVPEWAA